MGSPHEPEGRAQLLHEGQLEPHAGFQTALQSSLKRPRGWLSAALFLAVTLTIRLRARFSGPPGWA